jgi:hypothetical protein
VLRFCKIDQSSCAVLTHPSGPNKNGNRTALTQRHWPSELADD